VLVPSINQTLVLLSRPRAWRAAFILHHIEGLTIPEVTHLTGTTEDISSTVGALVQCRKRPKLP
jgi:hypothetical protein